MKKIHEVSTEEAYATSVNLCSKEVIEMTINYSYKDSGRQLMILDLGAPVSLAGISWMQQYLQVFGLTIQEMNSVPCNQPFVFGPSRRYVSESLIELPVLITRLDGREDVFTIQLYLVVAELPFLCGKRTSEDWSFQTDGREKILEITSKTDGSRMQIRMMDTKGGHYGIILETQRRKDVLYLEDALGDELGVFFLEDKEQEICSFKAVRHVHEVNRHKQKDKLIAMYQNAGWMSPELRNIIHRVVNDFKVCQKFGKSVARPRVSLPSDRAFNEVVTIDLKEFGQKHTLWMIDAFTRFIQGKVTSNKKADTIITTLKDSWCINVRFPSRGFFVDNGGEFANIKLDELTSKLGLSVKFGPSYSPWNNGL